MINDDISIFFLLNVFDRMNVIFCSEIHTFVSVFFLGEWYFFKLYRVNYMGYKFTHTIYLFYFYFFFSFLINYLKIIEDFYFFFFVHFWFLFLVICLSCLVKAKFSGMKWVKAMLMKATKTFGFENDV